MQFIYFIFPFLVKHKRSHRYLGKKDKLPFITPPTLNGSFFMSVKCGYFYFSIISPTIMQNIIRIKLIAFFDTCIQHLTISKKSLEVKFVWSRKFYPEQHNNQEVYITIIRQELKIGVYSLPRTVSFFKDLFLSKSRKDRSESVYSNFFRVNDSV